MKTARFGWIRDIPDIRDVSYSISRVGGLPTSVDLRASFPPVYDQLQLSACTGNACAGALAYARAMQGLPSFTPSRLMLYYDARVLEGTTASDSGAQIRDVIKGAAQRGACPEDEWPYDTAKFADEPSASAYDAALKDRALGYRRVPQDLDHIRSCLAGGDPIIFGISVFLAFESDAVAENGVVPMPGSSDAVIGGHAIVAVGYDDAAQRVIFRNSWGSSWGDSGYGYLPFSYITNPNLAADLWTIRLVSP